MKTEETWKKGNCKQNQNFYGTRDFGPSLDQVPNSGSCRSPFKEKRTAALVTWATAAAGFPSSYSRIVLILDLGDRCHGRLGEEQEPEGKTNIKNRYIVLFIDTSLILKSEPRECGSQVSKGAGKLPRILPHLKIEKLTRVYYIQNLTYFKKWLGPSPEYGTLSVPVLGKFYHMRSTVQLSSLPEPLQQQVFPHLTAEHSWSLIWVTIAMADLEKSKSLKGKPI